MRAIAFTLAVSVFVFGVMAAPTVLDDFSDPARWEVIKTEGVKLELSSVLGAGGDGSTALRLEYDFTKGAGFCIIRRSFDIPLPANYRFDLDVRGDGPANDLEFKLVSPSGDDVWWNNRRAFEPPAEWTRLRNRARHFGFAWGPSEGEPLERVGAIEFAIASSEGGAGVLEFDELTFEEMPDIDPRPVGGTAGIGGSGMESRRLGAVQPDGTIEYPIEDRAVAQWVEVAFAHPVEFGSIEIEWDSHRPMPAYEIQSSDDGESWRTIQNVDHGRGGTHAFFLPESEARAVRVHAEGGLKGRRPLRVRLAPIDETPDANAFWSARARAERRGLFPPYFLGERAAWTVVGLPGDDNEALISEYGAVESLKAGCTVEPFLFVDDRLVTWADADVSRSLDGGFRPIPTVSWRVGSVGLEVTALATGEAGAGRLLVRYAVSNSSTSDQSVGLELATRPFQVQPSYQWLNVLGGQTDAGATLPGGNGAGESGSVADAVGLVEDPDAPFSSTAMHRLDIPAGGERVVVLELPFHDAQTPIEIVPAARFEDSLRAERNLWDDLLSEPGLTLPESEQSLAQTFRTAIAHMLINQDGPAIQPGSRTYERSWIRDGSVTSLALIHAGHADRASAFIEWYAGFQFESGKVPCVVDRRGPDPVDEHDSTGEFIFTLRNAAIASALDSGDEQAGQALLSEHYDAVVRGVEYMESLRAKRLTDEYTLSGDPIMRACIGLMPESISHEGYSAKPMHSYWDDFWALRGYLDAADIARRLDEDRDASRFAKLALDFRDDLYNSIRLAADHHGIDHVPGCVELGDFDATSTSIAVFPVGELGRAPEPLLTNTFEKYWDFVVRRRDGSEAWDGMTPYELRVVGAFVRLGWSDRAHELMDWLLERRSPGGWNQWGEIAYADDSQGRFVGDMPHTWVASGYVLSLLSMFAYEDGETLVVAPAIPADWIGSAEGVGVDGLYTRWGPVSYTLRSENSGVVLELHETPPAPGGTLVRIPEGHGPAEDAVLHGDGDRLIRIPEGTRRVVFPRQP